MFCDLDEFKTINDSLGHAVGDELLSTITRRICGCVRDTDTVARLGGDEFGILLETVDGAKAQALAERILSVVGYEVRLADRSVFPSMSVGIANRNAGHDGRGATPRCRPGHVRGETFGARDVRASSKMTCTTRPEMYWNSNRISGSHWSRGSSPSATNRRWISKRPLSRVSKRSSDGPIQPGDRSHRPTSFRGRRHRASLARSAGGYWRKHAAPGSSCNGTVTAQSSCT